MWFNSTMLQSNNILETYSLLTCSYLLFSALSNLAAIGKQSSTEIDTKKLIENKVRSQMTFENHRHLEFFKYNDIKIDSLRYKWYLKIKNYKLAVKVTAK